MEKSKMLRLFLEDQDVSYLVELHNLYNEAARYDSHIWVNGGQFWDTFYCDYSAGDLAELVSGLCHGGKYDFNDLYVRFNGLGRPEGCADGDSLIYDWIDIPSIVRYIIENDCDFGDPDIRMFLDNEY